MPLRLRPADDRDYPRLRAVYLADLRAPMCDMWTSFAEKAEVSLILDDEQVIGFCAVDDEHQLHRLFLVQERRDMMSQVLPFLMEALSLQAIISSSLDPASVSDALVPGMEPMEVALLYRLPEAGETSQDAAPLRSAEVEDLESAIAFQHRAIGAPVEFLQGYTGQRVARGELWLLEREGCLVGTGELRVDLEDRKVVHLGLIVGEEDRREGIGTSLFAFLIAEALRRGQRPVCSTEPSNLAARCLIESAGFVQVHVVRRLSLPSEPE